jgi:alpha-amylase
MNIFVTGVVLALSLCRQAFAASGNEWRGRSIYQVFTDRFARTDGSTSYVCDTGSALYCGGTWSGLINRLDYIQNMGFDAIWISPVTEQIEGNSVDGTAYHGYWQTNINEVNSHFGTKDDLRNLAQEVHARGMFLMVDIVVNHFAWIGSPDSVDYTTFTPFNSVDYFHPHCNNNYDPVENLTNVEQCWMGSNNVPLPDVRTEDSAVADLWNSWIKGLVADYSIDGLRIDSVMEVNTGFWAGFQEAAGVYSIGEVYLADADTVCSYQDYLPGVFNYAT